MKRLRLIVGLMAVAILATVAGLLWFSPLMMVFCTPVAFGCAGLAVILFVRDSLNAPQATD